jgi:hypothetical protein
MMVLVVELMRSNCHLHQEFITQVKTLSIITTPDLDLLFPRSPAAWC